MTKREKIKKQSTISELRQDIVYGDWVVIATGRAKRPHEFLQQKRLSFRQSPKDCPFEYVHEEAVLVLDKDGSLGKDAWFVQVIPNKYPALERGVCTVFHRIGPYQWTDGVGFHEVVITKDHDRSIAEMSDEETELLVRAYQDRYLVMKDDECVKYISIFHNHGRQAGATISHPHSQIIAIPVIPPDLGRSLKGSAEYFHGNRACVHCLELRYELKVKERVVHENEYFVVLAPYASKTAFELRIFPRRHSPHFERIMTKERLALASALRNSLAKLFKGLRNPDYNFFLHTAPVADSKEFHHYHWHFEILPKTAIWAGFEIGTGIEISTISPEAAAAFLRKIKV